MAVIKLDFGLRPKQLNAILERLDNVTRELHDLTMAINSYNLVTDAPPPKPNGASAMPVFPDDLNG